MHVSALAVYPVKSLRGGARRSARVQPWGLEGDRRWMVVDDAGDVLTARTTPALLALRAQDDPDGTLRLTADGRPDLVVDVPHLGAPVPVTLSRVGTAVDAGDAARRWLTAALGRPARLVHLDDPGRRAVSPGHGGRPGDTLSLADAGPLLLTSAASLRRLDRWAVDGHAERYARCAVGAGSRPAGLAMERFRPNVVVDGDDLRAFAEDGWDEVVLGDVRFRVSELCDRCVLTTLDPATQQRTAEPLRSLAKHRRWDGEVWFGVRLVPLEVGVVRVGDAVRAAAVPGAGPVRGRRVAAPEPVLAG